MCEWCYRLTAAVNAALLPAYLHPSVCPSCLSKVQRSVSSIQKPQNRRTTEQGSSYSKRGGQADNRTAGEDSGRKGSSGSSTTKVPASPLSTSDRKKSATPSTNSILSTGTGRSRNSPLTERATLGQGIQNGKDSLNTPGSRASTASAAAVLSSSSSRPRHHKSLSSSNHPCPSDLHAPRPRQVSLSLTHSLTPTHKHRSLNPFQHIPLYSAQIIILPARTRWTKRKKQS